VVLSTDSVVDWVAFEVSANAAVVFVAAVDDEDEISSFWTARGSELHGVVLVDWSSENEVDSDVALELVSASSFCLSKNGKVKIGLRDEGIVVLEDSVVALSADGTRVVFMNSSLRIKIGILVL